MILRLALLFSIMLLFAKMILMAASYMAGEANDPGNLTPVDAVVVERNRLAGMQAEERVAEAQIALANAIENHNAAAAPVVLSSEQKNLRALGILALVVLVLSVLYRRNKTVANNA